MSTTYFAPDAWPGSRSPATQKKFAENEQASYRTGSMTGKTSGLVAAVGFETEMTMTPTGALYDHAETRPKKVAFLKDKEIWTYERLATEVDLGIERVLMAHPAVRDAAVVGVPDPDLGQRVAGFVQLADSAQA